MFESLNSPEIDRLALAIGAFVAVQYKDKYGVIPGGIIVPGFIIILFLKSPIWCLTVLLLSFPIYYIYKSFLERTDFKRRTPMYILAALSLTISNLIAFIYIQLEWLTLSLDDLSGTLLPAVITFTFTKQKIPKVLNGMIFATLTTAGILTVIYCVGSYGLGIDFDTLRPAYAGKEVLELKYPIFQFYIALAVGYLIYRSRDIRSGGYIVSPVAAGLLVHPISGSIFLLGCFLIYFSIQFICKATLVTGLKRYTLALFLSTVFIWSVEVIFLHGDTTILPFQGSNLFAIVAMMSYVNDGILYSSKNIFFCMAFTTILAIGSLFFTNLLAQILV